MRHLPQRNAAAATAESGRGDHDESLTAIDPWRLLARVKRRWRLGFAVAGTVFAAIVLVSTLMTPQYLSTASVLAAPHGEQDEPSETNVPPPAQLFVDTNAIDTDAQILGSHQLAMEVAQKLDLKDDPEFLPPPKATDALSPLAFLHALKESLHPPQVLPKTVTTEERVTAALLKRMYIKRAGLTYVIDVGVRSKDSVKAARISNAIAQAFIAEDMIARATEARNMNDAIGPRLSQLAEEGQVADTAVQQFKIDHGLLSANGATMAEQQVSALNEQIALAKADYAEKMGRLSVARGQLRNGGGGSDVTAALESDTIRTLRAQQADTSQHLAQLTAYYGDLYPDVIKTRGQLTDINIKIQQEIDRILSSLTADVQVAQQRLASLQASQSAAQGSLAANNASQVGLLELQRRADAAHAVYEAYLNASKETSAKEGVVQPEARVVSWARPSTKPAFPNMLLVMVLGGGIGMALGALAMALAEMFNRGFDTSADLVSGLGLPTAGSIPSLDSTLRRGVSAPPWDRYIVEHPFSAFAEAFRSLRTYLLLPGDGGPAPCVIAVTSALPREGKSTTAYCLAQSIAMAGSSVVLVDCDLRRGGLGKLGGGAKAGLSEVLQGKARLEDALVRDETSGAWLLPVRPQGSRGTDTCALPTLKKLLDDLRARFEIVLLDTAPVLAAADTRLIAAAADATLLLAAWRKTPTQATQAAADLLIESGANVIGASLARVDLRQQARSAYGDRDHFFNAVKGYYVQ